MRGKSGKCEGRKGEDVKDKGWVNVRGKGRETRRIKGEKYEGEMVGNVRDKK